MSIVYTGGTFDLYHAGHAYFLSICRDIAGCNGKVVVGLNTDQFVARYKRRQVACHYWEREAVLLACRYVDEVVENIGDENSGPTIDLVKPNFIVIGDDWLTKDYYAQLGVTREWLDERGIAVLYVGRGTVNLSSTAVRARIII